MTEKVGLKAVLDDKDFQRAVTRYVRGMNIMDRKTAGVAKSAGSAMGGLAGALTMGVGAAIGILTAQLIPKLLGGLKSIGTTLTDIGRDAIMSGARVKEMGIVVQYLGQQAGYTESQLDSYVAQIRAAGMRTDVAQKAVAEFARYQLDLAKATDLVNIAQAVAILAGEDSSETMRALIDATLTQNTLMLRRRGILVNMGKVMDDEAESLGKVANEMTDTERANAALNAIIKAGDPLLGLYEKAMESAGKQLRSMPRYTYELLLQMGMPFQDAFSDAVFVLVDFTKALMGAAQEGGWLNTIMVELGATVSGLAAPIVAFGREVIDVMQDLNLVLSDFRGPDLAMMRTGMSDLQQEISSLEAPDLSTGWEEEADKIEDINSKLAASIGRLWDDVHRAMNQAMDDWERGRARDLEDWIRGQTRALEDFRASIAEVYSDLDQQLAEMEGDWQEQRAEEESNWTEQRERDLERHEDELSRLREDAAMAQSKEEWDLIQELIAQKEGEFQQERILEETKRKERLAAEQAEHNAEMARERSRAQERASIMEAEFNARRERQEEDRRIRLEREREDHELRMARQREQATRREADLRAAAVASTVILKEQIAETKRRQQAGYEEQRTALLALLASQKRDYEKALFELPFLHEEHAKESAKAYERLSELFSTQLDIEFDEIMIAWKGKDWNLLGEEVVWGILLGYDGMLSTAARLMLRGMVLVAYWTIKGAAGAWYKVGYVLVEMMRAGASHIGGWFTDIQEEMASAFWDAGYEAIAAFGRGILYLRDWIRGVVTDLIGGAVQAAMDALHMGSPSKVFLALGKNIDLAFAEGIRSLAHLPALEMGRVAAGTMHSVSNVTTYHQQYNLSVHSSAPVEPIVSDFHMMQALGG